MRLAALGAAAVAALARARVAERDLLLHAERGVLERQRDHRAQVGAALRTVAARVAERTAAEEVAEDVAELAEDVLDVAEALPRTRHAGVAETVVRRPLVGLAQDLIGLRRLLEALLGLRVAGITIGMQLEGELAVGALEVLLASRAIDPEHFVIVALCHRSWVARPAT